MTGILLLLQERPRTSEEIARRFEVSRRTVLRDVQALCEVGVPIVAREGVGGGYSLPADFALPPLPLNAREVFLLLLSLSAVARLGDAPFAAERASLAAKLRAALPAAHLADADTLLETVGVEVPERTERAPFLEQLIDAAREGYWVRVEYRSADRASVQHLLPRRVFAEGGLWYCRAHAAEHGQERTYRVDRVRALEWPGLEFTPPVVSPPKPYHDGSHPEVAVVLTPRGAAAVESEPHLCPQLARGAGGAWLLQFRCPPGELDWYARFFAGLGPEADVRAPPELRERIRRIGEQIVDRYGD
jgi:predicted DNA-binding transcriptional regulator YafY